MQRNRILYFIIGVVLIIVGYIVRVTDLSIGGDIEEKNLPWKAASSLSRWVCTSL